MECPNGVSSPDSDQPSLASGLPLRQQDGKCEQVEETQRENSN